MKEMKKTTNFLEFQTKVCVQDTLSIPPSFLYLGTTKTHFCGFCLNPQIDKQLKLGGAAYHTLKTN